MDHEFENVCGEISYFLEFTGCTLKGESEIDCTECDSLHPEAKKLFEKAVAKYKEDNDRYYETICIHSGRRNSERQYHLYKAYKLYQRHGLGEQKIPANPPGYSLHEYGVAIDIVRTNDIQRLKSALENSGWKQHSSPKEAHHFDATGIKGWKSVIDFKQKLFSKYKNIRPNTEKLVDMEVDVDAIADNKADLKSDIRSLERRKSNLNRLLDRLHSKQESLQSDIEDLEMNLRVANINATRARDRYQNFRYTYCPDGNSLPNCQSSAHQRYRDRYSEDRAQLRRAHTDAEADVREIVRAIDRAESNLDRVDRQIETHQSEIKDTAGDLRVKNTHFRDISRELIRKERDVARKNTENEALVGQIQKEIDRFVKGEKFL